ncbi:MAG: bifunctional UDP-N-acetylglucosamine diphosphorylase/glucosamine-1-phosphate N-acetyltransferase GlmU [Rhizobiales bacterium]|nr:bifunctional UDP-N-acetylglucosamine diphosphorylase/glucosamine-1-phosphate N-acetyltransferase GlmU [Hyphomicrobiales bacterium]MBI3672522.1 bifunctional UDP-N-acetylglucosamine diphosphorylase/glucosamine-1-phosphate N-acetyltransferase GlmU [Hyphomicrobiales bacterium]
MAGICRNEAVTMNNIAIVVLAAGMGTRMRSDLPKVLHRAAGRSLFDHVLMAARDLDPARVVVVMGPAMNAVADAARAVFPAAAAVVQEQRLGTGHAVMMAKDRLAGFSGTILVLYGDAPLVRPETLKDLCARQAAAGSLAVLGFEAHNPHGYGRLITDASRHIVVIREELDATPAERNIKLCNSGIIAIDSGLLWRLLPNLGKANAKGEYYLTDIVHLAAAAGQPAALAQCPESEVMGVNDRAQLAAVERAFQERYRLKHMLAGVTLTDPATVHFSADTEIAADVLIEPHVVFGPGVRVASGVEILGFSHIEGAVIAEGARIGPFARLRPGAEIGANAHVGNYVEVKKAMIGEGAKVNHLSYIGDAKVGAKSNIGAGTITCNYDGFDKHPTDIGANVFVGSNTALVAPVKVGDGVNIAAGSVITRDIPADALAIARAEQVVREGAAARYRQLKRARKAARTKA